MAAGFGELLELLSEAKGWGQRSQGSQEAAEGLGGWGAGDMDP